MFWVYISFIIAFRAFDECIGTGRQKETIYSEFIWQDRPFILVTAFILEQFEIEVACKKKDSTECMYIQNILGRILTMCIFRNIVNISPKVIFAVVFTLNGCQDKSVVSFFLICKFLQFTVFLTVKVP